MSEVVRLYRYKGLLSDRRAVSAQELMAELEISPATFKRDLAKLRDQLRVPIKFNPELGGYQMEPGHSDSELPGLWLALTRVFPTSVAMNRAGRRCRPRCKRAPNEHLGPKTALQQNGMHRRSL